MDTMIRQRTTEEMMELILGVAKADQRIREVWMSGSRANPDVPKDEYQDFDVVFQVKDVDPFWDNDGWIERCFGKPALMQKPESMGLIPPDGDGNFVYLMLFPDGNRIDLCITEDPFAESDEPAILLLDKEQGENGVLPKATGTKEFWYVKAPTKNHFSDCCNNWLTCLFPLLIVLMFDLYILLHHNMQDLVLDFFLFHLKLHLDFSFLLLKLE